MHRKLILSTFTGGTFDLANPTAKQVDIRDIAHSLSLLCRFNGHCKRFYSVAEHSMNVADLLPNELKLWGLLHDAHEAYIGDVSRPLKKLMWFGLEKAPGEFRKFDSFEGLDQHVFAPIAERYGLETPMPAAVKHADDIMLATEARGLLAGFDGKVVPGWDALPDPLSPVVGGKMLYGEGPSEYMELQFLDLFQELIRGAQGV